MRGDGKNWGSNNSPWWSVTSQLRRLSPAEEEEKRRQVIAALQAAQELARAYAFVSTPSTATPKAAGATSDAAFLRSLGISWP